MNRKIKILFALRHLNIGGVEKVLVSFLTLLPRDKYDIEVSVFDDSGPMRPEIPGGIKVIAFNECAASNKERGLFAFARRVARKWFVALDKIPIRKRSWPRKGMFIFLGLFRYQFAKILGFSERYDIGIDFKMGHGMTPIVLLPRSFQKSITWIHADLNVPGVIAYCNKFHYFDYLFQMDYVFCVSNALQATFRHLFPAFPASRVFAVYNPICAEEILSLSRETQSDVLQFAADKKFIVSVGRLDEEKRFDRLFRAAAQLLNSGLDFRVAVVGNGCKQDELNALIKELGIEKNAKIFYGRTNPYPVFARADVFVSSSDHESASVVLTEAMILEKPIVATPTLGARDILQNGKYGLLVDFSVDSLADGLRKMLTDDTLRTLYQERLRKGKDSFPFLSSIETAETLFDKIVSE